MKKILASVLSLVLVSSISIAFADDATTTISIKKASDSTATVTEWSGSKSTATVPISFASDTDWTAVKDSYDVSPATADGLVSDKMCIMVNSDSGLSYSMISKSSSSKKSKKA